MNSFAAYEDRAGEQLAIGLGWFSIALGLAELAAPHSVARLIGVPPDPSTIAVLRSFGARELGNGAAILAQPDRATWMWSRVAGDALDLATLGGAINSSDTNRGRAMFATAAVLGVAMLDLLCARQLSRDEQEGSAFSDRRAALRSPGSRGRSTHVHEAVTINAPIERVRERWANLESLPSTLRNLGSLHSNSAGSTRLEFRAAPGGRGTEVHIECDYQPTGGALGGVIAQMFSQDPASQIRHDLRRFKQLMETGEITLSDGPALWRPAQPPADVQDARHAAGLEV
jgi:hypothetical protein